MGSNGPVLCSSHSKTFSVQANTPPASLNIARSKQSVVIYLSEKASHGRERYTKSASLARNPTRRSPSVRAGKSRRQRYTEAANSKGVRARHSLKLQLALCFSQDTNGALHGANTLPGLSRACFKQSVVSYLEAKPAAKATATPELHRCIGTQLAPAVKAYC